MHAHILVLLVSLSKAIAVSPMTERPGCCWDACCYARPQEDFEDLSVTETLDVLQYNQVGLITILFLHAMLHGLWCLAGRVPGFDLYDGSAVINANTHGSWWLLIDYAVSFVGAAAPYFGLHYNKQGVVEKGLPRTYEYLAVFVAVALLGAVSLFVQWGLTWGEFASCDSTLCTQYKWCFVGVLVFLFVDALILIWAAIRAYSYHANLKRAIISGKLDLSLNGSAPPANNYTPLPSAPQSEEFNNPPATTAGGGTAPAQKDVPQDGMERSIVTPLLQARLGGGGNKIRHTAPRSIGMHKK